LLLKLPDNLLAKLRSGDGVFKKTSFERCVLSPPVDDAARSIVGLGSKKPDIGESSLQVIMSRVVGECSPLPEYAGKESSDLAFGLLRALGILRCYVGVQCSGKQRKTLEISYCKCLPRSYRRLSCHKFRQRIRILEIDRFD